MNLATIVTVKLSGSREAVRDVRRKTDLRLVQSILEQYYSVNKLYPSMCSEGVDSCGKYAAYWFTTCKSPWWTWGWIQKDINEWVPKLV